VSKTKISASGRFSSSLSHTGVLGGGRHCRLSGGVVVVGTVAGEGRRRRRKARSAKVRDGEIRSRPTTQARLDRALAEPQASICSKSITLANDGIKCIIISHFEYTYTYWSSVKMMDVRVLFTKYKPLSIFWPLPHHF
jgi:hypothetical protein